MSLILKPSSRYPSKSDLEIISTQERYTLVFLVSVAVDCYRSLNTLTLNSSLRCDRSHLKVPFLQNITYVFDPQLPFHAGSSQ